MDKKEYMNEVGLNIETLVKNGVLHQVYYEKIAKALKVAWNTRDFEISMYWKRATYYWAFITSIFVAYFYILNSPNIFVHHDLVLFYVILIGCLFSFAWVLTNLSSKFWQSTWEYHINFLESEISGDIYGTVLYKKGKEFHPSISKINFCASCVILSVWILLLIHNLAWNSIKTLPIFNFMLNHIFESKCMILLIFSSTFIGLFKYLSKTPKDNEVYRL